eukprot:10566706-Ditylum_brightwellii.AAC.1
MLPPLLLYVTRHLSLASCKARMFAMPLGWTHAVPQPPKSQIIFSVFETTIIPVKTIADTVIISTA